MLKTEFARKKFGQRWCGYRWILCLFLVFCCIALFGCGGGSSDGSAGVLSGQGSANNYSVDWSYIQYRNIESNPGPIYVGLVGITDNGGPIVDTDVVAVEIWDSSSVMVTPDSERFFHTQILSLDCRTGTCNPVQQVDNTGVLGVFNTLAPDTYTVDVEMDNGQILTVVRDVPAPVLIPYVASAVMNSQYNVTTGDLELSWTNPTGQANWGEVDELVVILSDDVGNEVFYAKLAPTEESFTIPAALVAQAATIAGGTAVDEWRVRTVARDATNLVFSGGFSTLVNLP
ncbi:MAG: hypothetical protein P8X96_10030 [Desulfobacteraceae bacterium]